MPLFVHATNTTGLHSKERRGFAYKATCAQCGKALGGTDHVAAHVVRYKYPCLCPCMGGDVTLVTTCRACNAAHRADACEAEPCCVPGARFSAPDESSLRLGRVRTPWWRRHRVRRVGRVGTTTQKEGAQVPTYGLP